MKVTITPAKLKGRVKAIASKSAAHRLLICAALADRPTEILCEELSRDIEATAESLKQMGAEISYDRERGVFYVNPIRDLSDTCSMDVGESGSTLRFLLPVVCALGLRAHIVMHGRLGERPLSPLWEELMRHGCRLVRNKDGSVDTEGRLKGGEFRIAADVSSQFISGLLFALPLLKEPASIRLYGNVESEGYIRMTISALEQFGLKTMWQGDVLAVCAADADAGENPNRIGYRSPGSVRTEGDWSNAAFWEIAGMLSDGGTGGLLSTGLNEASIQGDRAVRELKMKIAAGNAVIDARDVPDLVPVLSVLAAAVPGNTTFTHAERLRIKESDRIISTVNMIRALGGDAEETADGLIVRGKERLRGGRVNSCNDHRIAMSAAVMSIACEDQVVIDGAEAVAKSYPAFWEDFEKLGGKILCEDY